MRLRAIDDVLTLAPNSGHGTPLKPGDEWAPGPGAIPEPRR